MRRIERNSVWRSLALTHTISLNFCSDRCEKLCRRRQCFMWEGMKGQEALQRSTISIERRKNGNDIGDTKDNELTETGVAKNTRATTHNSRWIIHERVHTSPQENIRPHSARQKKGKWATHDIAFVRARWGEQSDHMHRVTGIYTTCAVLYVALCANTSMQGACANLLKYSTEW